MHLGLPDSRYSQSLRPPDPRDNQNPELWDTHGCRTPGAAGSRETQTPETIRLLETPGNLRLPNRRDRRPPVLSVRGPSTPRATGLPGLPGAAGTPGCAGSQDSASSHSRSGTLPDFSGAAHPVEPLGAVGAALLGAGAAVAAAAAPGAWPAVRGTNAEFPGWRRSPSRRRREGRGGGGGEAIAARLPPAERQRGPAGTGTGGERQRAGGQRPALAGLCRLRLGPGVPPLMAARGLRPPRRARAGAALLPLLLLLSMLSREAAQELSPRGRNVCRAAG